MPSSIPRADYAAMFGPTTGDKVRLADTDLIIEVERDLIAEKAGAGSSGGTGDTTLLYGEEVKFGGGKVIRDGMGQSQVTRAAGAVDTVITNALIVDWTGIYKADVGLKDGRIAAVGKAGNPDTQPGVDIIVGPGTEVIAGARQRRGRASPLRPAHATVRRISGSSAVATPRSRPHTCSRRGCTSGCNRRTPGGRSCSTHRWCLGGCVPWRRTGVGWGWWWGDLI